MNNNSNESRENLVPASNAGGHESDGTMGEVAGTGAGAISGGIVGAAIGGPIGAVVGAVAGGMLGKAGGDAAHKVGDDHDDVNVSTGRDGDTGRAVGSGAGAVSGAVIGTAMGGPVGTVAGAVAGGMLGAAGGDATKHVGEGHNSSSAGATVSRAGHAVSNVDVPGNGVPGVQTGGTTMGGAADTRGMTEKAADAVTGDRMDDKTGRVTR